MDLFSFAVGLVVGALAVVILMACVVFAFLR